MPTTTVIARPSRHARLTLRPLFFLPLALFCTSIVGGLAVLATQLPVGGLALSLPLFP